MVWIERRTAMEEQERPRRVRHLNTRLPYLCRCWRLPRPAALCTSCASARDVVQFADGGGPWFIERGGFYVKPRFQCE